LNPSSDPAGPVEKGEKNGQKIAVLLMVMDRKLQNKSLPSLIKAHQRHQAPVKRRPIGQMTRAQ